jgi:hypothetical protein
MKTVIQIVLAIVIVVLGYLIIESIMKPIRFNKEKDKRYNATIERLKDIRTSQEAYKSKYNKYTASFDTLINFVKRDSFSIDKQIGSYNEDSITRKQAINAGIIEIVTTKVPVKDSLFSKKYPVDSLRYVPFTNKIEFEMDAGELETGSKVTVQVFEAKVHNDVLLHGMDKQLRINFNDEREKIAKYAGLKVGSMIEATNNAGNWE